MQGPNQLQKVVCGIAAVEIIALLIYPPMRGYMSEQPNFMPVGHDWLWVAGGTNEFSGYVGVNWPVLLTLWTGVLVATALMYWSLTESAQELNR